MDYDFVITNGLLLGADGETRADVAIRGETIAAVGPGLAAAAGDRHRDHRCDGPPVIPGGVDVHVHLELPFCGTVSSDDWNTGTRAAARGGVTTVIDFAIPYGEESLVDAFNNWMARAKPKACVDYCFHIAITNWDRHGPEMEKMVAMGCPTFKEFMIYASEGWQADDRAIYNTLERCRDLGAMLLVHAESSRVLDELIARHHTPELMRQHGARLHAMTRPNFIEAEAIQRAITWAEVTGGRLYIVHMSTAQGADLVKAAQARGVDVYAETCAQYLVLDDSAFDRPDGHLFACCPQIKKKSDQERLWKGLHDGRGLGDLDRHLHVQPGAEGALGGRLDQDPDGTCRAWRRCCRSSTPTACSQGRLTPAEFVAKCCTNPAKLMGLYPQEGRHRRGERRRPRDHRPQEADRGRLRHDGNQRRLEPLPGLVAGGFRRDHVQPRPEDRR